MPDTAKSIADLLLSLLEDWSKFARFLLLLLLVALLALGLVYGVLQSLPRNASQVRLGSGSIIFSQATSDGSEYLVMISPQGWQETGIAVHKGERLSIEANGRVHIDLSGLNAALANRRAIDEKILSDEKQAGRWEAEKNSFAPEDHYTTEQKQKIRPTWQWAGPDGLMDTQLHALPARMKKCVLPGANYGALLGAVRETGVRPGVGDVFLVGSDTIKSGTDITAGRNGKLYFTVNDVDSVDKDLPDIFLQDNIGFFYAKVSISRK